MQLQTKMREVIKIKRKKLFNLNEEICIEGTDSKIFVTVRDLRIESVTVKSWNRIVNIGFWLGSLNRIVE